MSSPGAGEKMKCDYPGCLCSSPECSCHGQHYEAEQKGLRPRSDARRTLSEQARERADEIRDTTVWNGRGTAALLDSLADETERLRTENADLKRVWQRERDRYDSLWERTQR